MRRLWESLHYSSTPMPPSSIRSGPRPWAKDANCLGVHTNVFFPERETGKSNGGHDAKKICQACPVNKHCVTYAIVGNEKDGIWGGCGEKDRRALKRVYDSLPDIDEEGHPTGRECDGWGWEQESCECEWCSTIDGVMRGTVVLDANGPNATHGLRVTYARGCRCDQCCYAAAKYSRWQRVSAA